MRVTVQRYLTLLIGLALVMAIGLRPDAHAGQAANWPQEPAHCSGGYAPGIVLVGLRAPGSDSAYLPLTRSEAPLIGRLQEEVWRDGEFAGSREILSFGAESVHALPVAVGQECAALETLRRHPGVAFAELDYAIHATGVITPDDPLWYHQWGPKQIKAPEAWDVTTGTSDVIIAIVDTGVQLDHEDLVDNLWTNPGEIPGNELDDDDNGKVDDFRGWHFYHAWAWDGEKYDYLPREDNQLGDGSGHGTHVAGIAGAEINNRVGMAGMAGNSRLMVVKVLDDDGVGWYSDLAQGIIYAVDNGARIINLSVGGEPSSQTLQAAVDYATSHGVLVVAAAGNNGPGVLYPAACEDAVAVAATDPNDQRAGFSNRGPEVDVAAPGVDIYSTWYRGDYFTKSGTSMAAPHVAGLAALTWSARPSLRASQVTAIITGTAMDVNDGAHAGWDEYLGWGRIEARRALSVTTYGGDLRLTAPEYALPAGGILSITATLPTTASDSVPITFAAKGGTVAPETTLAVNGTATTTLVAGPVAGNAVITAATETLSGVLYLRLLPGPVVSATLTAPSPVVKPWSPVPVTLWATDSLGNVPLDGTSIDWSADGGAVSPPRSTFRGGEGRAAFTPGLAQHTATVTASLPAGTVVTTTIDLTVDVQNVYLPVLYHQAG